ncbi:MAG: alpha/beta fold hydrolase [Terriglobales bacterium]
MGYAAPGQLVSVDGARRRLHVQRQGAATAAGEPTIVLDAALGGSCLGWIYVVRALTSEFAVISYDRAGLGWSPGQPGRRDLDMSVDDLEAVLAAVAAPPYVLVGHSYGALVTRGYAARHPNQVRGLILVDPPALEEWAEPDAVHQTRLATGVRLARRGAWAARCGVAQLAAWLISIGAFQLAAACARAVSGGRLRARSDFNFTPAAKLPPELKPTMRWLWTRPRFYTAMAQQMETLPEACRAVAALPPPEIPLVVLSARDTPPRQLAEHARMATAAPLGTHRQAHASGHWIPLEEPDLIVATVRELAARATQP